MEAKKKVAVPCSFRISDSRIFIVSDNTEASQALAKELDKKLSSKDIEGELCFEFSPGTRKEGKRKISIRSFFRGEYRTRNFTTPGNFEASNMLMNKLIRHGVMEAKGMLSFEFVPPKEIQWHCDDCGEKSVFQEGINKDPLYLYLKIQREHNKASSNCHGKGVAGK